MPRAGFFFVGKWITDPMNTPYELNENEKRLGLRGLLTHYTSSGIKQIGNAASESWSAAAAAEMDNLTVGGFLRRQGGVERCD